MPDYCQEKNVNFSGFKMAWRVFPKERCMVCMLHCADVIGRIQRRYGAEQAAAGGGGGAGQEDMAQHRRSSCTGMISSIRRLIRTMGMPWCCTRRTGRPEPFAGISLMRRRVSYGVFKKVLTFYKIQASLSFAAWCWGAPGAGCVGTRRPAWRLQVPSLSSTEESRTGAPRAVLFPLGGLGTGVGVR